MIIDILVLRKSWSVGGRSRTVIEPVREVVPVVLFLVLIRVPIRELIGRLRRLRPVPIVAREISGATVSDYVAVGTLRVLVPGGPFWGPLLGLVVLELVRVVGWSDSGLLPGFLIALCPARLRLLLVPEIFDSVEFRKPGELSERLKR